MMRMTSASVLLVASLAADSVFGGSLIDGEIGALKKRFNHDKGSPRLILLLSPT
ncbi:MAG: hypothetical protein V3U24_10425 [Candidatus Neomarinimicrobiota bacterium]